MTETDKPRLILVAAAIRENSGSEPGKGMAWALALAPFYRLEILTVPHCAGELQRSGVLAPGRIHSVGEDVPARGWAGAYWREYQRWCGQVIPACQALLREHPVAGILHVTVGTFRALPRFDRLGVPYVLGPLGGGECIPWTLLPQLRLPPSEILREAARAPVNRVTALLPHLRPVLDEAALILATTSETAALLGRKTRRGRIQVVFPDAIDTGADDVEVLRRREAQMAEVPLRLRCVCAGRAVWWKGMHLGIDFVHLLRQRGIHAVLDVYSAGNALDAWRRRAERLGLDAVFHGMVTRGALMAAYTQCHLFLNPTMHDSSSPALLEAYATGLPSMTLGLGGSATAATSRTGLNARVRRVEDWFEAGHRMVAAWVDAPARWLEVCRAAKARANEFGPDYLARCVRDHLQPVFSPLSDHPPLPASHAA
jgi:glycosyltransferase involved in cell wall biosynthesis